MSCSSYPAPCVFCLCLRDKVSHDEVSQECANLFGPQGGGEVLLALALRRAFERIEKLEAKQMEKPCGT